MRNALEPYLGKEVTVVSIVKEIEENNNKNKFKNKERVLLSKVINKENNEFLADHLWYPKSKFNSIEELSIGDTLEIKGKVSVYLKALYNKHVSKKFNYCIDFNVDNVKRVGIQKYNEKRIALYTDICKSRVRSGYYFTISNLSKIHSTLENKDYIYTKFLRDIIKSRLLNNLNYESMLIIDSKGSIYTKNKKYKEKIDLKANEIILCRIGEKIYGMGKVYKCYTDILEKEGMYEHIDVIDRWHELSNKDKDKLKVVSSNLEYISQPYIDSIERLKRAIEIEIEYNSSDDVKDKKISKNKLSKAQYVKDSIIIKTSLVRNRAHKNYNFKESELDVIYKSLVRKKFSIMMKIFNIVKLYLNNNIGYDHVLVINNYGKIYFIKVDRDNIDKNNYLEESEIEICRFGKKVIKKSNIYHDYIEILKREYDNIEDLDIWDLWYSLDSKNTIKENIVKKNFQHRKNGYINHYLVLVTGIEKEIEKQKMYCKSEFQDIIIY
ncbi:hypothetical protein [Paraclostridium sordellii]|uniref:hypothetical protein n=1 Tax=Paraclostridium sordellii TaxID=1505 RepID=UPI0005E2C608|nr:hypothetical protein [Paeniclostridium sordellii]CEO24155.1 Uncharacterised protein [[Clostridium] sordellii] [Paeniclostridium sordellii]